ncbi:MAG: hypothetical protein WDN08_09410 [Rhizomicrobium sp.]
MQTDNSGSVAAEYHRAAYETGNVTTRRVKLAVVLAAIACVWGYARFSDAPQMDAASAAERFNGAGTFPNPELFIATPGEGNIHSHIRSGPGAEYRIVGSLNRGDLVTGIARSSDRTGASWIRLAGEGNRFIKESVLRLEESTPP